MTVAPLQFSGGRRLWTFSKYFSSSAFNFIEYGIWRHMVEWVWVGRNALHSWMAYVRDFPLVNFSAVVAGRIFECVWSSYFQWADYLRGSSKRGYGARIESWHSVVTPGDLWVVFAFFSHSWTLQTLRWMFARRIPEVQRHRVQFNSTQSSWVIVNDKGWATHKQEKLVI